MRKMDHESKEYMKDLRTLIIQMQNITIYVGRCRTKINHTLTEDSV